MSAHNEEVEAAGAGARGRMRRALRETAARVGGVRRVSSLSLIALLCASAVAPVVLVGQELGPVLAAWLATAGSVGSNLLADVITTVVGRHEGAEAQAAAQVEAAVAAELEVRMAAPGSSAVLLRRQVAGLLQECGAHQVLLEALAEGDGDLQEVLAGGMALLAGQFGEFAGLLDAVGEGVRDLLAAAHAQQGESRVQQEHRGQVEQSLDRILRLLESRQPTAGGSAVVYNTLPPDTAAFIGRAVKIGEIERRVATAAAVGGVVAIYAINGMPGVGKSALAVHIAHRLSDRFPDRQLFVDLHAHSAGRAPADPAASLASLLAGDGVDPRQLPEGVEGLTALWRSRMADRRVLLVLDNAADSAQVAPLLPGADACLVLITSRRHLGDLPGAVDVSLDVLESEEAAAMFLSLAPRAAVEGEQELVAELVMLAGRLPLAISLLARVYVRHRTWSMAELIQETQARLLALSAENHTVAAAFDLSYHTLSPSRRRFFRLLGLHPGSDLDAYAAAALTGTSLHQATRHLEALHGDHLLTEPGYHRYGMHELIRSYARTQTASLDLAPDREGALSSLLYYYAHTAQSASLIIERGLRTAPGGPVPADIPALPDLDAARTWLQIERLNLDAAFTHAHSHGLDEHTIALATGMTEFLLSDGPWSRALEINQAAADAAARLDDPRALALALAELGRARHMAGDHPAAADVVVQTLRVLPQLGASPDETEALAEFGQRLPANYRAAADVLTLALEGYRQLGHHGAAEADALIELGQVRFVTGDYLTAAHAIVQALEIYRQLGHRGGEALALARLGRVQGLTGDYPEAADAFKRASEIYRQLGDCHREAEALADLGLAWYLTEDYSAAADAFKQAVEIYRQIGERGNEASALNSYAAALAAGGDRRDALLLYRQALAMSRELNKPDDEAISLEGIAEHLLAEGEPTQGIVYLKQVLDIYQRLGKLPDIERVIARIAELPSR